MGIEVRVPVLPESVADATLLTWHKQPGEAVSRDENLVDIETDKVVLDVPAPEDGILSDIIIAEGTTVTGNEIIAIIETGAAAASATSTQAGNEKTATSDSSELPPMSPAVRRLIKDEDLEPRNISGSGRGGRITKEDVLKFIEDQSSPAVATDPVAAKPVAEKAPAAKPATAVFEGERPEQRVPMTRLRSRVAERLMEAQSTTAMLTTFNEVNMQPVMDLRARHKEGFEKSHQVKLGFMSFFVKAATQALAQFPMVNASIDGSDMIYHGYYDIGIAVSAPRGLVVPILRDTDQMGFADVERGIVEYGKQASDGSLSMDALTGGTFTISNGGIFGSLMSTPILNPPQSAILGMHKIQQRPMAVGGEVKILPMMYLALTYDHRIIDGREAVQFLVSIKDALEDPARMLLEL